MDLIATVGGSDSNSYADLAYATSYFESRVGSEAWLDGDEDVKVPALIQATRILDAVFDWIGQQATEEQALRWPRVDALRDDVYGSSYNHDLDIEGIYYDDDELPKSLQDATCEFAFFLMTNGGYEAQVNDLKSVKVGPIRVDFNQSGNSAYTSIPNAVMEMLRLLGTFQGTRGGNQISFARVVRT